MKNGIRILFSLLVWAIALQGVEARSGEPEKEAVMVDYFAWARNVPFVYAEQVRAGVIKAFVGRGRHRVVDAETVRDLQLAPGIAPLDPWGLSGSARSEIRERRAEIVRSLGVHYVVCGTVTDCTYNDGKKGGGRLSTELNVALTVYDLSAGQIAGTESLRITASGNTQEEVDKDILRSLSRQMLFFIDRYFKFETDILQIEAPNAKGKYKELYIRCGSEMGVQNGDLFKVYEEYDLAGETAVRQIGKVRAREVCGERVTRCTISSGGQEIARAFSEGKKLVLVSDGQALF